MVWSCRGGATLCLLLDPACGFQPWRPIAAKRCFGRSDPTELFPQVPQTVAILSYSRPLPEKAGCASEGGILSLSIGLSSC